MASFKANSRNAALLEEFLRIRGEEFLKVFYTLALTNFLLTSHRQAQRALKTPPPLNQERVVNLARLFLERNQERYPPFSGLRKTKQRLVLLDYELVNV